MRLTKEQIDFIKTLKASLGIISIALNQEGVKRETFDEWMENPLFVDEVSKIDEVSLDFVENQLIKEIRNGNVQAIQYYLKTKGKKRGYN